MRKELIYPIVDNSKLQSVKSIIVKILENPMHGDGLVMLLNIICGTNYCVEDILEFYTKFDYDIDYLVETVTQPKPPIIKDLSIEETTEIIKNIYNDIFIGETLRAVYYVELLEYSFNKMGEISSFVFIPENKDMVQQVLDIIFKE
ncbi:MAG: hypothetical protein ACI4WH_08275 [Oscillospiraceae bacterium]